MMEQYGSAYVLSALVNLSEDQCVLERMEIIHDHEGNRKMFRVEERDPRHHKA